MDERVCQLKTLKKQYKRMRARAGWGWKVFAWLFFIAFIVILGATLFVKFNDIAWVQTLDTKVWEPFKSVLGQGINYVWFWLALDDFGYVISAALGLVWLIFLVCSKIASGRVKLTDTYRSWHTLKLTLETEKEERL